MGRGRKEGFATRRSPVEVLMHLDDGQLRAYLDDAVPAPERTASAEHISQCRACQERAENLKANGARVYAQIASLTRGEAATSAQVALRRFYERYDRKKEDSVLNRIFAKPLRPVWALVVVVALVSASMTFAPVRAWAGQFLGLFRVQTVEVLPVDPTLMDQLTGNSALSKQIGQLLSQSVTYTKKPSKPQVASNAAAAGQLAGFQVRLPTSHTDTPQIVVSAGSAFQFVVDRKLAQSVIDQAGRSDLQLPASLDGATIKVSIPAGVSAAYGDCPSTEELTGEAPRSGSPGRRFTNCVILAEIPSPTVDTPPDLDIEKLAELGLEFTGMKPDQAQAYAQTVDWTSTLVIPVPRNASSYNQVQVDGVTGYLIQRPVDDAPEYAVIWVNNGIVYAVGGLGTNSAAAIEMANSLK
jgi:hypothetical protein